MEAVKHYITLETAGRKISRFIIKNKPRQILFTLPWNLYFDAAVFWNELCKTNPELIFVISELSTECKQELSVAQIKLDITYSTIAFENIHVVPNQEEYEGIIKDAIHFHRQIIYLVYLTEFRDTYAQLNRGFLDHPDCILDGIAGIRQSTEQLYKGDYVGVRVSLDYLYSQELRVKMERAVNWVMPEIYDFVRKRTRKKKDDYSIARAVAEYMTLNWKFEDGGELRYTQYGPLLGKKGVCMAFALCYYKLLTQEYGIPCKYIIGQLEDGAGHGWNEVFLDHQWRNVDITMCIGARDVDAGFLIDFTDGRTVKNRD